MLQVNNLSVYIYVFCRMTGMIALNPIFNRRNVPAQVRVGIILCLTILLAPTAPFLLPSGYGQNFQVLLGMVREVLIGAVCAYIFLIFYYMLFFAGDLMDMQFGLSMARVFDPGTNIQASMSGSLFNVLFLLYFFATDSHLILIRAFAASFQLIPAGGGIQWQMISPFIQEVFSSAFLMILHLALPFIAAEFVVEVSMGVLMKLIPQIHVFVINIQMKVMLGLFMLYVFAQPISEFVDRYMNALIKSLEKVLTVMAGA